MKKVIILITLVFIFLSIYSQPCLPEGITFTTQAQIDNFQANYPGCTEIEGDVKIGDYWPGTDITNLNGLNILTAIGGNLRIGSGNNYLTGLEGLEGLDSIGGSLEITYNSSLTNLTALQGLTTIGVDLIISGNDILTSLSGLEGLTSIAGDLWIDNNSLTNLSGLDNISSVGGALRIWSGTLLSLAGMNNLTTIGGDLLISGGMMTNLAGLDSLSTIGGSLEIVFNHSLTSLTGLQGLASIEGDLSIRSNDYLASLSGLNNLDSVGGDLIIGLYEITPGGYYGGNPSLTNLEGLDKLVYIGGDLIINDNDKLDKLTGLEHLDEASINNLYIFGNQSLTGCGLQNICNYLLSPIGSINIYDNAPGCDKPSEVALNCGYTLPCLPNGNYYLLDQVDVDSFEVDYPGCSELGGDVNIGFIAYSDISNLYNLNSITSISGSLNIYYTAYLTNLEGLENLSAIGENVTIGTYFWFDIHAANHALSSLNGLEGLTSIGGSLHIDENPVLLTLGGLNNLTTIGGDLTIGEHNYGGGGNGFITNLSGLEGLTSVGGSLSIDRNHDLISLTGLDSIATIGGDLNIRYNISLTSLIGLENIESNSIENLTILSNDSLSLCEVESVCAYLNNPNGNINIWGNTLGCNSPEEVLDSCEANAVNIDEQVVLDQFTLYPNPASNTVSIIIQPGIEQASCEILDIHGKMMLHQQVSNENYTLNVSRLPTGLYFVRVHTSNSIEVGKLVIQ